MKYYDGLLVTRIPQYTLYSISDIDTSNEHALSRPASCTSRKITQKYGHKSNTRRRVAT